MLIVFGERAFNTEQIVTAHYTKRQPNTTKNSVLDIEFVVGEITILGEQASRVWDYLCEGAIKIDD
jgi:hypothetical protein